MSKTLAGSNDEERLDKLCTLTHKEQTVWFLNAFWRQLGEKEAANLWKYKLTYDKLDLEKGKEGNALDELNAHRFLEQNHETMTVSTLRQKLSSAGVDKGTKRKYVPIIHYLVVKYNVSWHELVNAPQGNQEEIAKAQRMLDEVQKAFEEVQRSAEAAKAREAEAKQAESAAKAREAEARDAEAAAKQAQSELEAALQELKAQEDAFNNKTTDLQRKSEEGGQVSRNKAKNELAQHLSSDPLPLRKAKTTMEAAVRKAERATKDAQDATNRATEARSKAEAATKEAISARKAAEAAVDAAAERVAEAEAFLEEVKLKPGGGQGAIWWMEEELREAKKYLPRSKGGI